MEEKKIASENVQEQVSGGLASRGNERVLASASTDYDRCPMCDNPTPVDGSGRCHCSNCGHSWYAGSH